MLTLALLCVSCSLMADEKFLVVKKQDVNTIISSLNNQNEAWNEENTIQIELNILDVKLDGCENGYAVIKYEFHCI